MSAVVEYQALVARVAAAVEAGTAEARGADAAFVAGVQGIEARLESARAAVAGAREAKVRADEEVARADSTAERVWRDARSYVGRRAAKKLPDIPEIQLAPAGTDPEALLSAAKDTMAKARRGEWSPEPVRYAGILAVLIGAVAAASIFGLARFLLGLGSGKELWAHALAQLAVFASPFAGIPLVVAGMARFWGQRTGVGTVALTVLGGLVVSCALTFLIR
ncbi:hypothetical protein [Longispora albida]|uniref:hypothetical protein n=1 Tax=Longispora albida TaxID=203523 RepID=UPI0003798062|nr:hypothetical protein [Longispora albida]